MSISKKGKLYDTEDKEVGLGCCTSHVLPGHGVEGKLLHCRGAIRSCVEGRHTSQLYLQGERVAVQMAEQRSSNTSAGPRLVTPHQV